MNSRTHTFPDKQDLVKNRLPRYTGTALDNFGEWILLTNFQQYVDSFAAAHAVPVLGAGGPMTPGGVKTGESDRSVQNTYGERHLRIGIESMRPVREGGEKIKHFRFG